VRWTNLQPSGVTFPQDSVYQKLLKSVERVILKNKKVAFQLHSDTVFVLLKDSQNTRKPMSDIGLLEKSLSGISQGSEIVKLVVTYFR